MNFVDIGGLRRAEAIKRILRRILHAVEKADEPVAFDDLTRCFVETARNELWWDFYEEVRNACAGKENLSGGVLDKWHLDTWLACLAQNLEDVVPEFCKEIRPQWNKVVYEKLSSCYQQEVSERRYEELAAKIKRKFEEKLLTQKSRRQPEKLKDVLARDKASTGPGPVRSRPKSHRPQPSPHRVLKSKVESIEAASNPSDLPPSEPSSETSPVPSVAENDTKAVSSISNSPTPEVSSEPSPDASIAKTEVKAASSSTVALPMPKSTPVPAARLPTPPSSPPKESRWPGVADSKFAVKDYLVEDLPERHGLLGLGDSPEKAEKAKQVAKAHNEQRNKEMQSFRDSALGDDMAIEEFTAVPSNNIEKSSTNTDDMVTPPPAKPLDNTTPPTSETFLLPELTRRLDPKVKESRKKTKLSGRAQIEVRFRNKFPKLVQLMEEVPVVDADTTMEVEPAPLVVDTPATIEQRPPANAVDEMQVEAEPLVSVQPAYIHQAPALMVVEHMQAEPLPVTRVQPADVEMACSPAASESPAPTLCFGSRNAKLTITHEAQTNPFGKPEQPCFGSSRAINLSATVQAPTPKPRHAASGVIPFTMAPPSNTSNTTIPGLSLLQNDKPATTSKALLPLLPMTNANLVSSSSDVTMDIDSTVKPSTKASFPMTMADSPRPREELLKMQAAQTFKAPGILPTDAFMSTMKQNQEHMQQVNAGLEYLNSQMARVEVKVRQHKARAYLSDFKRCIESSMDKTKGPKLGGEPRPVLDGRFEAPTAPASSNPSTLAAWAADAPAARTIAPAPGVYTNTSDDAILRNFFRAELDAMKEDKYLWRHCLGTVMQEGCSPEYLLAPSRMQHVFQRVSSCPNVIKLDEIWHQKRIYPSKKPEKDTFFTADNLPKGVTITAYNDAMKQLREGDIAVLRKSLEEWFQDDKKQTKWDTFTGLAERAGWTSVGDLKVDMFTDMRWAMENDTKTTSSKAFAQKQQLGSALDTYFKWAYPRTYAEERRTRQAARPRRAARPAGDASMQG